MEKLILSSKKYNLMLKLHTEVNQQLLFMKYVEQIFNVIGLSFIFRNQIPANIK